ncbi:hypothetical protein DsansV1_C25g0188171 [Dioscorea sansibarensis]
MKKLAKHGNAPTFPAMRPCLARAKGGRHISPLQFASRSAKLVCFMIGSRWSIVRAFDSVVLF